MSKIRAFTDGSCDNSKDPNRKYARQGGWGAVIVEEGQENKELSVGTYTNTTSARMELWAAVTVLGLISKIDEPIDLTIISDNKYVVDSYDKAWVFRWELDNWYKRDNADLWKKFLDAVRDLKSKGGTLKMEWVKGHVGHTENERADELANKAREARDIYIDDTQN